ncbi:MAG: hypothetical protein ACREBR_00195, partial [bacterium]
ISASSNNEMTFSREEPEGFVTYAHRLDMSLEELKLVFPALNQKSPEELDTMKRKTGYVPLQAQLFLEKGEKTYWNERYAEVLSFTDALYDKSSESVKNQLRASSFSCLLNTFEHANVYDKKFVVLAERGRETEIRNRFTTAFPVVKEVLLNKYWDEFLLVSTTEEGKMLDMCRRGDLPGSVMGQFFEIIIIHRLQYNVVDLIAMDSAMAPKISLPGRQLPFINQPFASQYLPENLQSDGVYIPKNRTFPAIDMVWKSGKEVWGVQLHIRSDHKVSLDKFRSLCIIAKWDTAFNQVYLLYLCPKPEFIMRRIASDDSGWNPIVIAASVGEIKGLSHTGEVNVFEGINWKLS